MTLFFYPNSFLSLARWWEQVMSLMNPTTTLLTPSQVNGYEFKEGAYESCSPSGLRKQLWMDLGKLQQHHVFSSLCIGPLV